jgi:U4/U6 small nuclear ribonucleoprotein PRP3
LASSRYGWAGQAHDDRNLARKLTPMERKDKKMKKLLGDAEVGIATMVSVYRVRFLSSPQLRFKVTVNAEVRSMCLLTIVF